MILSRDQPDAAADIEEIEQRRSVNRDMDVIYILTPQSHIVDCLLADFESRRYRRTFLFWTSSKAKLIRMASTCDSTDIIQYCRHNYGNE